MAQNKKLELTWVGKDEAKQTVEPRILIEDPSLSYGTTSHDILPNGKDWNGNMLIHGDNLLALQALLPHYANSVKCIYIDPPYNTGNAFEHYDDSLEHSIWLGLMRDRLILLRDLLSDEGVIFISIDDDECHYLKVLCDEVFGRKNFAGSIVWEKKKKPSFLSNMGSVTEYVLAYSKDVRYSPPFIYGETTVGKKYPFNNAGNGLAVLTFPAGYVHFSMPDGHIKPQDMSEGKIITRLLDELVIENGVNKNAFRLEGEWRYSQSKLDAIVANGEGIVISKIPFRPNHIKSGGEPKKMKNLISVAHYGMDTYEDATKESIALFGKDIDTFKPYVNLHEHLFIEGEINERFRLKKEERDAGKTAPYSFKIKKMMLLGLVGESELTGINVTVDTGMLSPDFRKRLVKVLKAYPGKTPLNMYLQDRATGYNIEFYSKKYALSVCADLIDALSSLGVGYSVSRK